jgi:hypothetical protein
MGGQNDRQQDLGSEDKPPHSTKRLDGDANSRTLAQERKTSSLLKQIAPLNM